MVAVPFTSRSSTRRFRVPDLPILKPRVTPFWSLSSGATVNDDEKPASMWRK